MQNHDIIICGAGIIGLTIARELVSQGHRDILIFDKESKLGTHASGRNSGVLHAGVYYDPGSLKAKVCLDGNLKMREFCEEHDLPLFESGKVLVARTEEEVPTLFELQRRTLANGGKAEIIDEAALAEYEPNARTVSKALHSPLTAVVDPKKVLAALEKELISAGVKFLYNTRFTGCEDEVAHTSAGNVGFGLFINAAGAHGERVSHCFGVGLDYQMVPFKGIYKVLRPKRAATINGSIYPVPNIKNPFLGVHFTRSVHGDVYIGPTAIPALGRENYGILKGMDAEFISILMRDAKLFLTNPKFRGVAMEEPRKYFSKYFFNDARKLVKELEPGDIMSSPKAGIRPQLVDKKTNELVLDFLVETGPKSVHVLNAISPAFTSSMAFAEMVVREYVGQTA